MSRAAALAGVIGISFSAILVRAAGVSPGTSSFFRAAYALPLLAVLWLRVARRDHRTPRQRAMAVAAGLFLAIDLNLWHRSIEFIGAGLSTVIANLQVVLVGLAAWLLYQERPAPAALMGVPLAVTGVALTSGLGRAGVYGSDPVAGSLLAAGAAVAYTGFLLLLRAGNRGRGPAAGPILDATLGTFVGALILAPLDPAFSWAPTWPAHGWLVLLGIGAHACSWLAIVHALPRLPALTTSVLLLIQPCLTLAWGLLLFAEQPSPMQWAGVGLVLCGVGAAAIPQRQQRTGEPALAGPTGAANAADTNPNHQDHAS